MGVETFTFLFTDIEGSTALLGRLGEDAYARVLAGHHAPPGLSGLYPSLYFSLVAHFKAASRLVLAAQDGGDVLGAHAVKVEMKLAGCLAAESSG